MKKLFVALMLAALPLLSFAAEHGPELEKVDIDVSDKAAMQGVLMSMASDPQVMPLLMAAQTGTDSGELVASLNVCDLGATAVSAIKTLPQPTKGRAFADLVHQMELGGGDLGGLPRF